MRQLHLSFPSKQFCIFHGNGRRWILNEPWLCLAVKLDLPHWNLICVPSVVGLDSTQDIDIRACVMSILLLDNHYLKNGSPYTDNTCMSMCLNLNLIFTCVEDTSSECVIWTGRLVSSFNTKFGKNIFQGGIMIVAHIVGHTLLWNVHIKERTGNTVPTEVKFIFQSTRTRLINPDLQNYNNQWHNVGRLQVQT